MTIAERPIDIQPGALLATAPAEATIEQLNDALAAHGLCLPVAPLLPGLSLAALVAANAGGRRRLGHGPIGRYLRGALIDPPAGGEPIVVGGPTIKRATGYGLHRAIAGADLGLGRLRELTLSLRALPAARAALLIRCADLAAAWRLGARLYAAGLPLSALAVADGPGGGLLLAELEGAAAVVDRQLAAAADLAAGAGAAVAPAPPDAWATWEALAVAQADPAAAALDLTVPRAAGPELLGRAAGLARRYGMGLRAWGDAGVGALHLGLTAADGSALPAGRLAEAGQLIAVLASLAAAAGGSPSTEMGRPPRTDALQRASAGGGAAGAAAGGGGLIDELRAVVGPAHLITRAEDVATYETDASIARPEGEALAVALPATTAEVAGLLRAATAHGVPVVTRGAGSGLAGGTLVTPGALVIGLNRMEQIRIDREQMVAHVGAGVVTGELQKAAEALGLFYPPDPSSLSASTIGGNIACNAGGPRCVKYGVTADYVLALTAVLADGTVVRWGDGLAGQGPENGLAQLLVGSEGTLAVITEATLRLLPLPAARRTISALFRTLDDACATVEQIMAAGLVPAAMEIMEDATIAAVEAYLKIGLPADAGAMLLMMADGEPEAVAAEAEALAELARRGRATRVEVARSAADEANLWRARRTVSIALTRVRPNRLGEDICVPLPQIAACVRRIKQVSAAHGLPIVVFGHAGDGNLHPNILFDARDPAETARLWPCAADVFQVALDVGGTLSGEHGIGTLKRPFMARAIGAPALAAQARLKSALDPQGLLNPGKVLPDAP